MPRTLLQLAGVTAILVAAKYEEIYAPTVRACAGQGPSQGCRQLLRSPGCQAAQVWLWAGWRKLHAL